jgi:hypothetical protein
MPHTDWECHRCGLWGYEESLVSTRIAVWWVSPSAKAKEQYLRWVSYSARQLFPPSSLHSPPMLSTAARDPRRVANTRKFLQDISNSLDTNDGMDIFLRTTFKAGIVPLVDKEVVDAILYNLSCKYRLDTEANMRKYGLYPMPDDLAQAYAAEMRSKVVLKRGKAVVPRCNPCTFPQHQEAWKIVCKKAAEGFHLMITGLQSLIKQRKS